MKAILVESRAGAHDELLKLQPRYPDIEIVPIHADFRAVMDEILRLIPTQGFAFFLVDPKGWRINMQGIRALLARPNSEVLFNFMFEFINRAASMSNPDTIQGLDELLPIAGWRDDLKRADGASEKSRPDIRKRILIDAFGSVLKALGNYTYVADVPVLRPIKNRQIYSLVYATRMPKGIEVFRDCQIKTLVEQESVRSAAKVAVRTAASKQEDLFGTNIGLAPDPTAQYLESERAQAEQLLLSLVGERVSTWGKLWPQILTRHAIRRSELNVIVASLNKAKRIAIPKLQPPKRVPADDFEIFAASDS